MDDGDAGGRKGGDFVFAAAFTAADDGPGMAHALALGGRKPGNKAEHGLGIGAFADVGGGFFFSVAADFADQADGFGFRARPGSFRCRLSS